MPRALPVPSEPGTFFHCDKYFRFLLDEFGCRITSRKSDSWSYEVTYRNATTAVKVRFEPREKYAFISLHRIVDGKIPQAPIFIRPNSKLYSFGLDNLLMLRSPATRIRKKYHRERFVDEQDLDQAIKAYLKEPFTEQDLEHMIKTYAAALQKYGADILRGDFRVFADLDKIVKKRGEEFKKQNSVNFENIRDNRRRPN